jgi:hypothetical protein
MQSTGSLLVSVRNDTNVTLLRAGNPSPIGISLTPNVPTYGPKEQPPPPWSDGKEYQAFKNAMALTFGIVWSAPAPVWGRGAQRVVRVNDMSAKSVLANKTYEFTVDTPIGPNPSVRVFWAITGVAGGSTLVPGFGLFNLATSPGLWTYVTPPSFTGRWAIELLNQFFAEPVTLGVVYVPPRHVEFEGDDVARLTFSIAGARYNDYWHLEESETHGRGSKREPVQELLSPRGSYASSAHRA